VPPICFRYCSMLGSRLRWRHICCVRVADELSALCKLRLARERAAAFLIIGEWRWRSNEGIASSCEGGRAAVGMIELGEGGVDFFSGHTIWMLKMRFENRGAAGTNHRQRMII
jgi:hypothetical protein